MRQLIRRAISSNFLRNMTVLTSGAMLAQMIPLLMLPVFTRMFPASAFAIQALLQLGIAFVVPIATGFYEWAIPIPRQKRQAHALATFVIGMSIAVNLLVLLAVLFLRKPILKLLHANELGDWIYAYPAIIFATCLLNLSNYWLLRQGKFTLQSLNRVVLSVCAASIAVVSGLLGASHGLVIGFVSGTVIAGLVAFASAWRQGLRLCFSMPASYATLILRKYSEFPLYGSLPSAINNLASQLPLVIITAHYTLDMTGHYAVARNLLSGGVGLISACIGQVVLKHVSDQAKRNERLWPHYLKILGIVAVLGFGLSAGVYVIGPWLFHLYLGEGWEDSAEITRVLSVNLMLWLMGPSLALAPIALRKLKSIALWQFMYGGLACGLFFFVDEPFPQFMWRIVTFELIAYGLYVIIVTITMWRHDRSHRRIKPTTLPELETAA